MGLKDKVQQGDVTSASWANVTMADGILEALFGLEFGHADFADDADFFCSSSITHHDWAILRYFASEKQIFWNDVLGTDYTDFYERC